MSRCSWRFLFVRFPYQTAGDIVDVRQAAGDGFAVDADLGGGVHLREPAHDIKLHDLLIDLIQYALVGDALPVAAREVFQLLRQSQPRSYLLSLPSARRRAGLTSSPQPAFSADRRRICNRQDT